jgi:glycerol-3-phosphate dehydrogenase
MKLYNCGISGSTIQHIEGRPNCFSTADGRYTKLPDVIDYLTIFFGWNDHAFGKLGTIDDKENTATTAEGLAKVRALAAEQVDAVAFGKVITSFTGLRSVSDVGDFVINSPLERFINVAGIESPGLSSAPAIGEYVCELVKSLSVLDFKEKADFYPKRRAAHWFSMLSIDEKNEVIKAHPEYAHIICRCELVTEGEILDAIRTNPKPRDLDGVKRRTRATMGRCQGGFCSPYIVELLSAEMGCDYGEVTKFGRRSFINVGKTKEV